MSRVVVLDAGPLGRLTQRKGVPVADACRAWVMACLANGARIVVPEVSDYEVRRELIRQGLTASLARLDTFIFDRPDRYVPITTEAMRRAADLWAAARNAGVPTADKLALDADVILAGQALTLQPTPTDLIVASVNVRHISRYILCAEWSQIVP